MAEMPQDGHCPNCGERVRIMPPLDPLNNRIAQQKDDEIERLRAALTDACDNGLIYWEPQTSTGAANKALMMADINRLLSTTPTEQPDG